MMIHTIYSYLDFSSFISSSFPASTPTLLHSSFFHFFRKQAHKSSNKSEKSCIIKSFILLFVFFLLFLIFEKINKINRTLIPKKICERRRRLRIKITIIRNYNRHQRNINSTNKYLQNLYSIKIKNKNKWIKYFNLVKSPSLNQKKSASKTDYNINRPTR